MLATIFYKLLSMSLIAAVIGLIILIIRRFFDNKIPPIWKYLMWSLVIIALMMPYKLKTELSLFNANHKIEQTISNTIDKVLLDDNLKVSIPMGDESKIVSFERSSEVVSKLQEEAYNEWKANPSQSKFNMTLLFNKHFILKNLIPVIWLLGTSLILLAFALTRFKLLRNTKKLTSNGDELSRIQAILSDCKANFNIHKDIQITIQDNISSPAIMGILKPAIFLPKYVSNMNENSITHILYHELAHYKRKDTIVNYLLLVFNAVYWFNPLIWLIFKFIRDDIEILTDEFVINKIGKEHSKTYSKSLVEVLANANRIPFMPKMLCMVDGKKNIERRISMIKLGESFKKHKLMISVICLLVIALIAGVFLTSRKVDHKIAIYVVEKAEISPDDYESIIKSTKPSLTEKDIKAYNKDARMIFLQDDIMQKYRDYIVDMTEERLMTGGSMLLGTNKDVLNNCFLITVDDKVVMTGALRPADHSSYLPETAFIMTDATDGLRIGLTKFFMAKKEQTEDYKKEETDLAKAFEEMDLLTDKFFDIRTQGVTYSTDDLWKNRTKNVGDNSKMGGIVNNLVLPKGTSVESFSIASDKEPYSLTVKLKLADEDNLAGYWKEYNHIFESNAGILLSLVGNLNVVKFKVDNQSKVPEMVFVNEDEFDQFDELEDTVKVMYFPATKYFDICQTKYDFYLKFSEAWRFGEYVACEAKVDEEDEVIWDKAPMVYIEGSLYVTDPRTSVAKSKLAEGYVYIGEIKTVVDGSLEPINNFESNCYGVGTKVYQKDDVLMLEASDGKYERFIKVKQKNDENIENTSTKNSINKQVADRVEKHIADLLSVYSENIDKHDIKNELAYQSILKMGDDALNYMLNEFKKGRGEDNRGIIMMMTCREILGAKDNVEGEFNSGMEWYNKFKIREEVRIDNFEYSGGDEDLKLVYNTKEFYDEISRYFEDGGFHVSAVKIYETAYEEDYLKVFFHLIFSKYKLYIDDDGKYVLDETGGLSAPYAITYKKDESGKYQFVKYDMPKDGAYFGSSIESFCTMPLSNTKIEDLATRMVSSLGDKELLQNNLIEHLTKNNIKDVFINGEGDKLINHRQSSKDFVGGTMRWPLDEENNEITSYYVESADDTSIGHLGIDVAAPKGANIYAALDGEVIVSKYSNIDGQTITIHHGGGIITRYAHASERLVTVGQTVKKGDVIAKVGATGRATGYHLHFDIREDGDSVDPLDYLTQP